MMKQHKQKKQCCILNKIVITQIAQGQVKGTRRIVCLDYTLNHNQK